MGRRLQGTHQLLAVPFLEQCSVFRGVHGQHYWDEHGPHVRARNLTAVPRGCLSLVCLCLRDVSQYASVFNQP